MARIETDPNYSTPTFSRATAGTDLFKKEDVQALAAAVSTHDHSTGKGLALAAGAIPAGSITSAMIADATIDTADLKDGAVTSAKIADGTIATVDLANAAVTNAKLGVDTARANLLTNGGFEIWQRGNGPFAATGGWTADRWQNSLQGTDTLSISRDTANADVSGACAACTFTKGSGTNSTLLQTLAGAEYTGLRGRTVTLSLRVKTSTASAVRAFIQVDASPTLGTTHTGDGTYQTLTVSAAVGSTASGIYIGAVFPATCTAYVDNAMLVVGAQAADYVPLHPADDLTRCQRYYEVHGGGAAVDFVHNFYTAAGQPIQFTHTFMTQKAVTPTMTKNGTWNVTNAGQPAASDPHVSSYDFNFTVTATGSAQVYSPNATCFISAEANP